MSDGGEFDPGLVERVLGVVRRIPHGRVLSYGDVARLSAAPTGRRRRTCASGSWADCARSPRR